MAIPVPVSLEQPPAGGDLLAQSRPLPADWRRGIAFSDASCLAPAVLGECPSTPGLVPTGGFTPAVFRPVTVALAVECSTFSGIDLETVSADELSRVHDYALARELLTGEASERDASPGDTGNPSLTGEAVPVTGAFVSVAGALGALETALAEANYGRGATLFLPFSVAYRALAEGILWREGTRWRSVTGATIIVSAGFDGRAPGVDGGVPPEPGAPLYVYAVTTVWAGLGERSTRGIIQRDTNTALAQSEDLMLAAFGPCAVFAVEIPDETAGGGVDGLSAFQVAEKNGFVGTEEEWLATLVGPAGADSTVPGPAGSPGVVQTIVAGTGIVVDSTDPANPTISTEA